MSARMVRLDLPRDVAISELLEDASFDQVIPFALNLEDVHVSVPINTLWTPKRNGLLRLRGGARIAVRGTTTSPVSLPFSWGEA